MNDLVKCINELYITDRSRYIIQNKDGSYTNSNVLKYDQRLTDKIIEKHLKNEITMGVFCSEKCSKFITFDVDMKEYSERERRLVVKNIVDNICDCGIGKQYINVIYSGNKGYHITIFFNDVVYYNKIVEFYEYILFICGYNNTLVELRPSSTLGMKLPLSVHKVSKHISYFVDDNFTFIKEKDYIKNINVFDRDMFQNMVSELSISDENRKLINIINEGLSGTKFSKLGIDDIKNIEETGLIRSSTRNYCCVQLAIMYNTLNTERKECENLLNLWIDKQDSRYYNSSKRFCYKENKRITKWVYDNNVRIYQKTKVPKEIYVCKKEIRKLNEIQNEKYKNIAYCMLVHSKIYSNDKNEFHMTYDQILYNIDSKYRNIVPKALKYLEENNYVEIISRDIKDVSNKYKVLFNSKIKSNVLYTISSNDYTIPYLKLLNL